MFVVAALVCAPLMSLGPGRVAFAAGVVGDGTQGSCTESALDEALINGGTVTFNCGAAPHTITVAATKTIADDTMIDGGGSITLEGSNGQRVFMVSSGTELTLRNLTFANTTADRGPAVRNAGTLIIENSAFVNNEATIDGGAVFSNANSTLVVDNSEFSGNQSARFGGAVYVAGGTQASFSRTGFSGNHAGNHAGAIFAAGRGELIIQRGEFNGNVSDASGGAINVGVGTTANISKAEFTGNHALQGGAIFNNNQGDATLSISESLFSGNWSYDDGGVIYSRSDGLIDVASSEFTGNRSGFNGSSLRWGHGDGGVFYNSDGTDLTISGSTFVNNRTGSSAAVIQNMENTSATIVNSTFLDNLSAYDLDTDPDTYGTGVIFLQAESDLTVTSSTFVNVAAIHNWQGNTVTLTQNILIDLGGSGWGNCSGLGSFSEEFASGGYNIANDDTCNLTDVPGDGDAIHTAAEIGLQPLGDNGGPTRTRMLAGDSVAIDTIPAAECAVAVDQRGAPRPVNGMCDAGAVEFNGVVPPGDEPPTATSDDISELEDVLIPVVLTAVDDGTAEMEFAIASQPQHGNLSGDITLVDCQGSEPITCTVMLDYMPDPDFFGTDSFTYTADDGMNESDPATISITVEPVNDAPTFTAGMDQTVVEDSGPQSLPGWATDISAGANNESSQSLGFVVEADNPALFSSQPAVSPAGTLSYTPAPDAFGSTLVTVYLTDDGGTANGGVDHSPTASFTIDVTPVNDPPVISDIAHSTPAGEGSPITISVTASDIDTITPLQYSFDCDDDDVYEVQSGTAAQGECTFPDNGDFDVGVRVFDGEVATTGTITVRVSNLPPVIDDVTTNAPVPPGDPAIITVTASDPGINDTLTYAFDCDNDSVYETAGAGNQGVCSLVPGQAISTVGIEVRDDDGGVTTATVDVRQGVTLCANAYTGVLSSPLASGACPPGSVRLLLPDVEPVTLCIHPYTGQLTWSPRGACSFVHLVHVVPDDGPLDFCRNAYTGKLRYSPTGGCSPIEGAGVIPG